MGILIKIQRSNFKDLNLNNCELKIHANYILSMCLNSRFEKYVNKILQNKPFPT